MGGDDLSERLLNSVYRVSKVVDVLCFHFPNSIPAYPTTRFVAPLASAEVV
jgi:hypothetical protein